MKKIGSKAMISGLMLVLGLTLGCQKADDENFVAPSGSTIVINPDGVSIEDGSSPASHTQYFTITVYDSEGRPMNGQNVTISFIWATPDVSNLVQLYDGETPVTSPFTVKTNDSGIYNLKFVFWSGGLEYSGQLEARSGSAYAAADFEVTVP